MEPSGTEEQLVDGSGRECFTSIDEGATWGETRFLPQVVVGDGIIRLKSGALALYDTTQIWLSDDDSETWDAASSTKMLDFPYYATMIQLGNERLLWEFASL